MSDARTIIPTPKTPLSPAASPRRGRFGGAFLVVSVALHVLFGVGATLYVVQRTQAKRQLAFQAGPTAPARSQREVEHRVLVAKQRQTSGAPAPPRRVAVTGLARVSLPEPPSVPSLPPVIAPQKLTAAGGVGRFGNTPGVLPGSGVAGAGSGFGAPATMFGSRDGRAPSLAGTFYDLKLTRDRKPSGVQLADYPKIVGEFLQGGWDEAVFSRYFRGPQTLHASQIFIPNMDANEGPKAFDLAYGPNRVEPRMWVVLYRAKVVAPETGKFRFVGFADDVLDVAFDGKTVLDGSLINTRVSNWPGKDQYVYEYQRFNLENRRTESFRTAYYRGDVLEVEAGSVHEIQVLIGEWPGANFAVQLLVEKLGVNHEKDRSGSPKLPVFQLSASALPTRLGQPPTAGGWVWRVAP